MPRSHAVSIIVALLLPACGEGSGGLDGDRLHYSAEGSISTSNDSTVLVVGEAGAVDVAGGLLTIEVERSGGAFPGSIDPDTRSLVGAASARQGDTLHLRYTVDDSDSELSLVLDDALASVPAPDCTGCGVGWTLVGPAAGGMAPIDLSVLDDPTPPFVIANVDGGDVVVADSVDEPVSIPAVSGAQVCVHQRLSGVSGPARCEVVP